MKTLNLKSKEILKGAALAGLLLAQFWLPGAQVLADSNQVPVNQAPASSPAAAASGSIQTLADQGPADSYDDGFWYGWNPFEEMARMEQMMHHMMRRSMAFSGMGPRMGGWDSGHSMILEPRMDLQEAADHYEIKADLPGMDKSKLDISVQEGMLTISGERREQFEQQAQQGFYRMERSIGAFQRTVPLPPNVKEGEISAQYENGVLTITIPKEKPTPPPQASRKIKIQ